ncbi:hypothetical protein J5TS2_36290 [Brevibacillus halotolerans]|uniref:DUF6173 family protein n=1 Tax=Brevibacillus halotolerans TaxID=1507437 RepID=UPI001B2C201F|nr:DUF6173 family protein [Brevibacillus halotolerans]GIO02961.1 hypothetical protein J5TS2_36290 [Brevibacillus halotolerans]
MKVEDSLKLFMPRVDSPALSKEDANLLREMVSQKDFDPASNQFTQLMESIKEFESELDNDHEIALHLASFGKEVILKVHQIGYVDPSLLEFSGTVDGQKAKLVQNVNQLNFMMCAVQKPDLNKPARRVGFVDYDEAFQSQE